MGDFSVLPRGEKKKALRFPHFPTHFQAVIWRNWGLVTFERLAGVLGTTVDNIKSAGQMMGLQCGDFDFQLWARRGYLTILRKNWHLLNYEQLCELLDWTPERLAFVLREDDFFWHKMGHLKPEVDSVSYKELTGEELIATREMARTTSEILGEKLPEAEKPFGFLGRFGGSSGRKIVQGDGLRMIYSYAALYGDPLLDDAVDPLPEGLLAEYAKNGINAVWLQAILYTLVPWLGEKPAAGHEKRIASLNRLVAKARRHGIKVYLYLNEPRGVPARFFENHPEWAGAMTVDGNRAFCTENPGMLAALSEGIQRLCDQVSEIGGLFAITQSENLTHCLSRPAETLMEQCPVCRHEKNPVKGIVRILTAINNGIKTSKSSADLIAWNWAWNPEWDEDVLKALPKEIRIQCVSETDLETDCQGIKGRVIDYSISKVGPGPTARRLWDLARKHHHDVVAKIQINTTWENAYLPYLPTPQLVKRHLENLRASGVKDFMVSWTLGGYPGDNLELLDMTVEELAVKRFGPDNALEILEAWDFFCRGFELFPFHSVELIYFGPQSIGPANLLFREKTNYGATMVGFPYDDLPLWGGNGHYPDDVLEKTFLEMSKLIGKGFDKLVLLESKIIGPYNDNYRELRNIAEAFYCNMRSAYLQIAFIRSRDGGRSGILEMLVEEESLAKRLLRAQDCDSRIGFEATNQYMYLRNDLIEKVLNCRNLAKVFQEQSAISVPS